MLETGFEMGTGRWRESVEQARGLNLIRSFASLVEYRSWISSLSVGMITVVYSISDDCDLGGAVRVQLRVLRCLTKTVQTFKQ